MVAADIIRDALTGLPDVPVPYPDAWRYAFIVIGLLVAGLTLAITTEAKLFNRTERRRHDRRRAMALHIQLVSVGANLIVLELVALVYLRLGMGPMSPLIYPALLGELLLAAGLVVMLARRWQVSHRKEHHRC